MKTESEQEERSVWSRLGAGVLPGRVMAMTAAYDSTQLSSASFSLIMSSVGLSDGDPLRAGKPCFPKWALPTLRYLSLPPRTAH